MTLDTLRDDLAQIACDHDQHAAGLPPVRLTNHPFALADYRARVQPLMGRIAVELARVAVEHSPHGRVDPLFSWDPSTCGHRLGDDPDGLPCSIAGSHATHVFKSASVPQVNDTEAVE